MTSDVFLCHNSKDKPLVMKIAQALEQHKVTTWIDKNNLNAGEEFLSGIQEEIPKTKSGAIFFGLNGVGQYQKGEIDVLYREKVKRQIPLIPVLLPGVNQIPNEYPFLQKNNWLPLTSEEISQEFLDKLVRGIQKDDLPAKPMTPNIDDLVLDVREKVSADIQKRCETMRVLDMTHPIGLSDIYTDVNPYIHAKKSQILSPQTRTGPKGENMHPNNHPSQRYINLRGNDYLEDILIVAPALTISPPSQGRYYYDQIYSKVIADYVSINM